MAWFADLIAAAEELGYGVASVTPREITLVPFGGPGDEVTLRSVFLRGAELRRLLRPVTRGTPVVLDADPFNGGGS